MIVVWRVTERCNLACAFCAYDRRVDRPRRDADPRAVLAFGAALAAYQQEARDSVLVSWLGGEPLLWRPLRALSTAFARDLGLRVSATTNGTALASSAVRAHVLEHYAELTVSVDGFAPFHDRMRGRPGAFATLRRAVADIAEEKRRLGRGPLLRANVVLMRDNVDDFEPLCVELASWGVEQITFNQLGGRDRPEFFAGHHLRRSDVDTLAARIRPLRTRLAAAGTILRGDERYVERIRSSVAGAALSVHDCAPGERFLFVTEDGLVAPCSFTSDMYGISIAELTTAADLLALPARFAETRSRRRALPCGDCPSTQVFGKFAHSDAESVES